jgi:hypothetical protein
VGSWSLAKKLGNLGRLVTMRSCKGREGVACIIGVLLSTAHHDYVSKYHAARAGASAMTLATDFADQLKGWAC